MRTIRNLTVAITVMASIISQGCNESQKGTSAQQTGGKAEKQTAMNYDIKDRDAFTLMGIQTRITAAEEKNPETFNKIWDSFEQYKTILRPISVEWRYYGVSFPTNKKDAFDYLAGTPVHSDAKSPDPNLISRTVPAAKYAVFKCTSFGVADQDIGRTYQYIYGEWLPKSRYKLDKNACCFEQYAPREWANRPIYIYIPIVPK